MARVNGPAGVGAVHSATYLPKTSLRLETTVTPPPAAGSTLTEVETPPAAAMTGRALAATGLNAPGP